LEKKLARDVRFLKLYAVVSTALLSVMFFLSASPGHNRKPHFEEIDVERINIVEKDGRLRMVISDQDRQHPGIVNGKIIKRDGPRPPGMIFFDQSGDEMGGLVFGENGSKGHFGSLTFDKVRNDQTIGFRHLEGDNGAYSAGFSVWQQPNLPSDLLNTKYESVNKIADESARKAAIQEIIDHDELSTQRLFLGKGRDNSTLFEMSDIKGKPRIKMQVTAEGMARLDFLDETGKVTYSLPAAHK
jgi:hypothetical protein